MINSNEELPYVVHEGSTDNRSFKQFSYFAFGLKHQELQYKLFAIKFLASRQERSIYLTREHDVVKPAYSENLPAQHVRKVSNN